MPWTDDLTYDPLRSSLMTAAKSAFDAGFLGRQMPDLPASTISRCSLRFLRKKEEGIHEHQSS